VTFWNPNFDYDVINNPKPEDKKKSQARHSGGTCEFSLSYDGGKSFGVIGTYKKSCPDSKFTLNALCCQKAKLKETVLVFYAWPITIPEEAPACEECIFAWSWINASGRYEFYSKCLLFLSCSFTALLRGRHLTTRTKSELCRCRDRVFCER
jgi:hypothetical protein